jgi:hypothetical protein
MENFKITKAARTSAKIKVGIQGPSGSGKTLGSLKVAFGLTNDWSKITVIDTEHGSANLYAHLGEFNVLELKPPYTPERYINALNAVVQSKAEVVIIDSISHEWIGSGGILEAHGKMSGNSFTNWAAITPRHNNFVETLLAAPIHILSTIRTKQDYVLVQKNGKQVPEKVGLKGLTREGMDYEFTLVFDVDINHLAKASKDRTSMFNDKDGFYLNEVVGHLILEWCGYNPASNLMEQIEACNSLDDLYKLYECNPDVQSLYKEDFLQRKKQLSNLNGISHGNING